MQYLNDYLDLKRIYARMNGVNILVREGIIDFLFWLLSTTFNHCCNGVMYYNSENQEVILEILTDFVSNHRENELSHDSQLFEEIYNYAQHFNDANILKMMDDPIPKQVLLDDILGIIFRETCTIFGRF